MTETQLKQTNLLTETIGLCSSFVRVWSSNSKEVTKDVVFLQIFSSFLNKWLANLLHISTSLAEQLSRELIYWNIWLYLSYGPAFVSDSFCGFVFHAALNPLCHHVLVMGGNNSPWSCLAESVEQFKTFSDTSCSEQNRSHN